MANRQLSGLDHILTQLDQGLRTVLGNAPSPQRVSPAAGVAESELSEQERRQAIGLMRVNHAGEICAQALYQGQALTAKLPEVGAQMEHAAEEEIDHLAWCEERIQELGGNTSALNPLWYAMSFGIGAGAGLISDKLSLGFVAATEEQVCSHLRDHLKQLPDEDRKSSLILQQMLEDEQRHGDNALEAGGMDFPRPIKQAMSALSLLMTRTSYRI